MERIAVIILNYNGAAMLRTFLPSVVEYSAGATIVVADNASTDDSLQLLHDSFPTVKVLSLDKNYGFAGGYNRALEFVDEEYCLLLNSDVEVTEGWLAPLLSFMDKHSEAVACQPKILAYKQKTHFEYAGASGGFIDRYGYPYCRGRIFASIEEDKGQYNDPCRLFWATGAALLVRRSEYLAAGGLDERFFAHMEEIDLCWRMLARGGVIYVVPQSVVYHVGGATLQKSNPKKTYLNFRNNLLMLHKNLPSAEYAPVMRTRTLLDYIAAFKFLVSFSWGDFKAVLKARRDFKRMRDNYSAVRNENLEKTVVGRIDERSKFSILWQYYFRRKKRFSQLSK